MALKAGDPPPENEQSMDDILASIRRIMLDEQARLQDGSGSVAPTPPAEPPAPRVVTPAEPVLILDASMAVEDRVETPVAVAAPAETPVAGAPGGLKPAAPPLAEPVAPALAEPPEVTAQTIQALLAPAAAAAAAASVDALLKQLGEERLAQLKAAPPIASPTVDELVRSELRPLLKAWLDENLPPLVERLVRAEINRLIGRSGL